ncbi:MAG: DUF4932 domain-containing protein [Limnohabitans sp.]|nr:DUF4932 domain-containing protein [Limnohabitans sp.]
MRKQLLLQTTLLFIVQISFGQKSKLDIRVDEKMELITTVQYLSNYSLLTKSKIDYKKEIDTYFEPYKNHPIIELSKTIQNDFFMGSSVPWYLYQFSFPDFYPLSTFTDDENQIEDYIKHKDTLELYKKELKDFYVKSNFHSFFVQHKNYYDSISKPVKEYINKYDIVTILESHYGEKKKKYALILSPLLHDGGFGAEVNTKKGREIYAFIGPKFNSVSFPNFDTKDILQKYVLHEFSHSFCNPIINKNIKDFEKLNCLEKPIEQQMAKQGYGDDWPTCLYEHLVRANEIVLTKNLLGVEEADKLYDAYYTKRSWIYLKGLVPIIENTYLTNRKKYKTEHYILDYFINYLTEEKNKNCH